MRSNKRPHAFLVNSVDHFGREIDPEVLAVAQHIADRAMTQAEMLLGDPARALTLLEEMAATVTSTIRTKIVRSEPPIEDLDRYLYLAFIRRVRNEVQRTPTLLRSDETDWEMFEPHGSPEEIERKVLAHELLADYDTVTAEIILRRYGGQAWREIGAACGISATAARLRFRKAILQIRRRVTEPKHDPS
jgi:DNA-directed RNA polymerase specialized sigma24 family protein